MATNILHKISEVVFIFTFKRAEHVQTCGTRLNVHGTRLNVYNARSNVILNIQVSKNLGVQNMKLPELRRFVYSLSMLRALCILPES